MYESSKSSSIRALCLRAFLLLLFSPVSLVPTAADDDITSDPAFEARLTRPAQYRVRAHDTFERVSRYLYGKRTWWKKLRDQNPTLSKLDAADPLPRGMSIRYLAPVVGDSYVVRQGDWLIRIVEWKYGNRQHWEEVFHANSHKLSNPNLIHPGDVLRLTTDGVVSHSGTGEVLLNGQRQLAQVPPTAFDQFRADLQRALGLDEGGWFGLGLATGLMVLLLLPVFWWFYRPSEIPGDDAPRAKHVGIPPVFTHSDQAPRVVAEAAEEDSAPARDPRPGEYPYTFKRRPSERPAFDPRSVPRDPQGDIRQPASYHSLVGKRKAVLKPKASPRKRSAS